MPNIESAPIPEAEILKKHPNFRYVEGEYKDIQKATRAELEALKKKYEKAIREHELPFKENRTTIFSDLLSEVEARRKTLPVEETRIIKVQRLKKSIEGQNGRASQVDVGKLLRDHREKSKDVKIPITIDLAPDIRNDPFWKGLEAYMFKSALQDGNYYLCVQEKGEPNAICVVEFSQEDYERRISKDVPVKDRVGRTYGIGKEIILGI